MKLWQFTVLAVLLPTVLCQKCPSGWMQYNLQCFQLFSNKLNWHEARMACQGLGGDLAALKTIDINNFIAQYVKPTKIQHWIGLHDITDENKFTWCVDEELMDLSQNMWDTGQPDNWGSSGEDCAEMRTNGKWNDIPCMGYERPYICERPNDVLIKCDESNGWISAASSCYKFYGSDYTWSDANNYCKAVGSELISVQSQEEQDVVSLQSSVHKADIWIGATDIISGVPGGYTWPNGIAIGPYTNWGLGQPDNSYFSMGGDCAEVVSTAKDGQWNTAPCTSGRKFICEKPEGTCPDGWRIFRGNCYQLNTHSKYTWTDSKHLCETQGSFLVDIQSAVENNYIVSLFEELQDIGITDFWIGVSDIVTDGIFAWSDGTGTTYHNWHVNEPSDTVGSPDCGTIFIENSAGKWSTTNCYGLQAFVCKVPIGQPVFPVPPELSLGDCPPGWNLNGENCFYVETAKVKYADAKVGCESMGAKLTSIHSPEEQSYHSLRVSMNKDWLWIGFHDISNENKFEWEDKTPVDFTNWGPGQPDNWGDAGEDCTHMRSGETDAGQWNDLPCTSNSGYMCKLPKACDEYTSGVTDDKYYYRYHPAQKSVEYIYFEAMASNDVHIGLSPTASNANPMYEIVIGGSKNTVSAVRRCAQCTNEIVASTPSILNMNEWRGFWITYNMNTGKMEIGKEAQQAFITYTDPNPIQVKYVGYSTGWDSEGKFRFCNLTNAPTPEPTPVFDPRCGLGWEYDYTTKNCYLFKESDYMGWQDAEEVCKRDGGNLVSITSVAEQTYINARLNYISEAYLWIGANDMSSEGGWEWTSGDPFRFLNWNPGEPNNYGPGEHCGEVYGSNGKWNDDTCIAQHGYICKKTGYLTTHFTMSPNLYLPGNDNFRLRNVYPDECAHACVWETNFNCLSFDYNRFTRECDLSDTTGSLNGELFTDVSYDYYEKLPGVGPDPMPTTLPPSYRCEEGWSGYSSFCYQVQNVKLTMQEARTRCRTLGGDLVSIHSTAENDYVLSIVKSFGVTSPVWIGLNDLALQHSFDWTDASVVDYTFWNAGEPNNYGDKGEDCVEMYGNGAWNDQECQDSVPSVCKRMKTDMPPTQFPITPSGCSLGWIPYEYSCYFVEDSDMAMWVDAITKCESNGGDLVSVADRFEQSVLTSQLGLQNGQLFWIGLSDLASPGEYTWSDGSHVTYTHWDQGMPDNGKGDCVAATSGIVSGMWQDSACNNKFNYVCEKGRIGFTLPPVTQPPPRTNPSNQGCATGWIGYGNNCFRVDEVPNSETLFWVDARQHCLNMGADLASFHSMDEEDYIREQAKVVNTGAGFWIGLHDQSQEGGFEWTDGTPVDHTGWDTGEPNNVGGEDCVEMFFNTRGWNDMACDYYRSWVCIIPKGVVPYTTPAPPTPSPYPNCPSNSNWMLRGDYCYYYSAKDDDRRSWGEANNYCMDNGGYLASIHSMDENDFITDVTVRIFSYHSHWIGIRTYSAGGTYAWSDGSPLDYVAWSPGEPNDYNGEEECAEFYAYAGSLEPGSWNDLNCGDKIPFICKKANGAIAPITYPPTPVPIGNCPTGAYRFDHRCYQFHGAMADDRLDWESARAKCEDMGMELATLHSQQVQSFLTTQLKDVTYRIWIGLSDRSTNGQFRWADGTSVDFTNWNNGEPNEAGNGEDCVEMLYSKDNAGLWNDNACDRTNGYVCQRNPDPSLPNPGDLPNKCKTGYVQYYDNCFRVITSQSSGVSFAEAQTACQSDGTALASIMDNFDQAFVETQLHVMGDDPLWIGLVDDKVAGGYIWVDGWPVWYTNWGQSEPSMGPGEGCVALQFDGSWDDTVCTNKYMPLCKYSFLPTPTNPPDTPGTCEDGWLAYSSFCYIYRDDYKSWPEAEYQCEKLGATIASIHSKQENEFIKNKVAKDTPYDLWLGLHRDDDGGFVWHDNTPVDYVNWAEGEPTWEWDGEHENCVEIWYPSGYWNDIDCLYSQYYVCKKGKMPLETDKPPPGTLPPTTRKPPRTYPPGWTGSTEARPPPGTPIPNTGLSSGGIVGIVIGILIVVALVLIIAFFLYRSSGTKSPLDIGSVGFDNALYNAGSGAVQVKEKGSIDNASSVA